MFVRRRRGAILPIVFVAVLLAVACGGDGDDAGPPAAAAPAAAEPGAGVDPSERAPAEGSARPAREAVGEAAAPGGGAEPSERAVAEGTTASGAGVEAEAGGIEGEGGGPPPLEVGDLRAVEDFTFAGRLRLDLTEPSPADDVDVLGALEEIVLSGGFVAPSDFDLVIRLGEGPGSPPLGVVRADGRLYTNFGLGWEEQPGDAETLLGLAAPILGVGGGAPVPGGLDVQGGLAGLQEWARDLLAEPLAASLETEAAETAFGPATRTTLPADSLWDFVQALLPGLSGFLGEGAAEAPAGETPWERAAISLLVDDARGTLVGVRIEVENLAIGEVEGGIAILRLGRLDVDMTIDPAYGLPASVALEAAGLEMGWPDVLRGDFSLHFTVGDINAGLVRIAPPI